MARRSALNQPQIMVLARQAVNEVEAADDMGAAARRVLADAPERQVRQAIVEISVAAPDRVTGALVGAALRSGDEQLVRTAADLLIDARDSPQALDVLRQCLTLPDPPVRQRAVEAMESFSDPATVSLLPAALQDESDSVRSAATSAIGLIVGLASHPLRQPILDELADPDSDLAQALIANEDRYVRRQAVQGLAIGSSDAVLPTLEKLCADEDDEVRHEAVLCLTAIGTERATELMATMLEDTSYVVASSVLDMLAARLGATSAKLLEHVKRGMGHSLPEVRRGAVLMLNRFGGDEVLPVLEKATRDDDFEVARRAADMLRKFQAGAEVGWLAEGMAAESAGQRALVVWEAGSIGLEAASDAVAGETAADRGFAPMLERALREGSASDRMHAVNELSGLLDIARESAMRDALDDPDPSVRSRAADTLQYTRDASFLVR
ncbi:MAG: HEAT repeat domain-containing protein, partial [Candidatus Brocadiae bacterium]|nr:HEAT repeat domain-containing protein [Candidatus Brocadiia bacterium]